MQTILLNIVLPGGKNSLPLQVPLGLSVAQLLQYLREQGHLPSGKYGLSANGAALPPDRLIGDCGLTPGAAFWVSPATPPVQPTFGGKKSVLENTVKQYPLGQAQQAAPPPPKPEKKGLLAWLFS